MSKQPVQASLEQSDTTSEKPVVTFGIGKKLISAISLIGLMCIIVSVVGWQSIDSLSKIQEDINTNKSPAITEAMKLENMTTKLVASIPSISSAPDEQILQKYNEEINALFDQMGQNIEVLIPLLNDEEKVQRLNNQLETLPPLLSQLNENVSSRLKMKDRSAELTNSLVEIRNQAKDLTDPLRSTIVVKSFDMNEEWKRVIDNSIETARSTEGPVTYDLGQLEMAGMRNLNDLASVIDFKSAANLLAGKLLQGSRSADLASLKLIQDEFLQSIANMAGPLTNLNNIVEEETAQKLDKLYQDILILGSNGDENENVLKLREAELNLQLQSDEIFENSRITAEALSATVSEIASNINNQMQAAVTENRELATSAENTLVVISVISVILIFLIAWLYIQRNLISRLLQLVDRMEKIADGDLTVSVNRNGNDEITLMAAELAILRNGLRETEELKKEQETQRVRSEQEKRENELRMANDFDTAVGSSISILSTNATDIRGRATEMSDLAKKTLTETQQVSSASDTVNQDITLVAQSAEELSKSITEISEQVTTSTTVTREAVGRAANLNENIKGLEEGSKKIEDVINLINTIAEQTNLLALNATIEAARAGEAGKGFAVVASEVKNLANQTTRAIDNISLIITDIQSEINNAVQSNSEITSIIDEIDNVSASIASAVEEQSAATSDISRTVKQTAEHVSDISNRVQGVSSSIMQNTNMVTNVLDGVSEIDSQSNSMSEDLNSFLDELRDKKASNNN